MKKLALALVCLISAAFFASCDPTITNPEPTIAILSDEGCLIGGEVVDMDVVYPFGFIANSNPQTQKELSKFVVICGSITLCDTAISGTDFTYKGEIVFSDVEERDIVGSAEIVATVTDVAGNIATATIKVDINKEIALVPKDFTWNRHGGAPATGLDVFGLEWNSNTKDVFANIKPMDGAVLYEFEPDVWENTNTQLEKAELFNNEQLVGIEAFRKVSCYYPHNDYDFVIGTTYNGENYLIHITANELHDFKGTDVTIYGQYK